MNYQSDVVRRTAYKEQWMNLPADFYALGPGQVPQATATVTLVANTAVVMPVFIDRPIRITDAALLVTTADADEEARVGLFRWDPVNRECTELVKDFGLVALEATGLGLSAGSDFDLLEAGWYAWAVVSDGVPVIRVGLCDDRNVGGSVSISTTTMLGATHYTAVMTTPIASGFPADASAIAHTPVTSNSEFRKHQGVFVRASALNYSGGG